jgi:two-component system sensor kinase FixL
MPERAPRDVLVLVAYLLLYTLLDLVSFIHPWAGTAITPWNPPPALSMALLIVFGLRFSGALFVASMVAEVFVRGGSLSIAQLLAGSLVLTVGYAASAAVLSARLRMRGLPQGTRELGQLLGVISLACLLIGTAYVSVQAAAGVVPWYAFSNGLLRFWVGDAVGILVNLPLLLAIADPVSRRRLIQLCQRWESLVQVAAILLALWLVFGLTAAVYVRYFYLLFLPVVWIAVRHGLAGAAPAVVIVQIGLMVAVAVKDPGVVTVLEMQAVMLALTITALLLGAAVDERQRMQEELQQSLRLATAGEMAAALAHELNQPLTAIVTYGKACELMYAGPDGNHAELPGTIRKVVEQSQRVGAIVRRLRDFLRSGKMDLQETGIAELISGVEASFTKQLESHAIVLGTAIAEDLPRIWVDRLEIEIVLRNLVANAIDSIRAAQPPTKRISIEVARHGQGFVRFSLYDTGPGVSHAMRDRLFAPFATSKAHGMGLGLAVSRAIVEAHGGRLWADSAPSGAFHLTLPTNQGDVDDPQE